MSNADPVVVASLVTSAIIGTGAVGFFVRYGTRLSLLEKLVETSQLITLHPRVSLLESAVQDIKVALGKLHMLDAIAATLKNHTEKLEQMVPRKEQEAHWQATGTRFDGIDSRLDDLAKNKN